MLFANMPSNMVYSIVYAFFSDVLMTISL